MRHRNLSWVYGVVGLAAMFVVCNGVLAVQEREVTLRFMFPLKEVRTYTTPMQSFNVSIQGNSKIKQRLTKVEREKAMRSESLTRRVQGFGQLSIQR